MFVGMSGLGSNSGGMKFNFGGGIGSGKKNRHRLFCQTLVLFRVPKPYIIEWQWWRILSGIFSHICTDFVKSSTRAVVEAMMEYLQPQETLPARKACLEVREEGNLESLVGRRYLLVYTFGRVAHFP